MASISSSSIPIYPYINPHKGSLDAAHGVPGGYDLSKVFLAQVFRGLGFGLFRFRVCRVVRFTVEGIKLGLKALSKKAQGHPSGLTA